ncbi:SPW repeat domain-containing protein [Nocardia asteroides]|uniref:SPW repeat domain-containing protein n=1 Tax=Nocardia asteroides TaxID=1824 RepID=UPI001E5995AE|nr:hypothetical protein [Nocardia asteroides]UGT62587.1 hypothetical protein LTT61_04370 [Nocardia asteroides]
MTKSKLTPTRALALAGMAAGVFTMVAPAWAVTTAAGAALLLGIGSLIVIFALWSLVARDPTKDHWALSVAGFMLFSAPWVGGFAGDGAAWVAWLLGAAVTLAGGSVYVLDEDIELAQAQRVQQMVTYMRAHDHTRTDPAPAADRPRLGAYLSGTATTPS